MSYVSSQTRNTVSLLMKLERFQVSGIPITEAGHTNAMGPWSGDVSLLFLKSYSTVHRERDLEAVKGLGLPFPRGIVADVTTNHYIKFWVSTKTELWFGCLLWHKLNFYLFTPHHNLPDEMPLACQHWIHYHSRVTDKYKELNTLGSFK